MKMTTKSALDLLCVYGDDASDDDEVPGCRASTKRMHRDDDTDFDQENKRFEKLPVPNFLLEKVDKPEFEDNPNEHDGRIRSFPHERGNWATYVYVPFERNECLANIIKETLNAVPFLDLKTFEEFHLSLTRTVILKHHWIESFITSIKQQITSSNKFVIMLDALEIYLNDEKTRTFIGITIRTAYDSLVTLVKKLDRSLNEFNLPSFYEPPSFHISILWCNGNQMELLKNNLSELNKMVKNVINMFPQEYWYKYVECLECKCGNKQFQFFLT